MLTVIFKSGAVVQLHCSEKRWKYNDVADIVSVQADGDELNAITNACPYLNGKQAGQYKKLGTSFRFVPNSVQRWFGADAQHAMSWWPTFAESTNLKPTVVANDWHTWTATDPRFRLGKSICQNPSLDKITKIKFVRENCDLFLKEAKEFVEYWE